MPESHRMQTPRHLWIIGVVALLWNALGAFDYLMTQTKNEAYMNMFTPEQLDFFYNLPSWSVVLWAIAVWGSVIACVLLLLRKSAAVWFFLISLISVIANTIYLYVFADGIKVMGDPFSLIFSALIIIVAVFLYLYSKKMSTLEIIN
jgi:hypothetical protein